jgi:hypothetical protein
MFFCFFSVFLCRRKQSNISKICFSLCDVLFKKKHKISKIFFVRYSNSQRKIKFQSYCFVRYNSQIKIKFQSYCFVRYNSQRKIKFQRFCFVRYNSQRKIKFQRFFFVRYNSQRKIKFQRYIYFLRYIKKY